MKNLYKSQISEEEIRSLPLLQFDGTIHVIATMNELITSTTILRQQPVLGFDTETRPTFKKGKKNKVVVLQLSTELHAYLFLLNKTGLHPNIIDILTNEEIIKAGAAIKDDLLALRKRTEFEPAGFVELQKLVKNFGIEQISLKKMTALVLGGRISKSQQTSNWEKDILSDAQILYAATDAWCTYKIYTTLLNHLNYG